MKMQIRIPSFLDDTWQVRLFNLGESTYDVRQGIVTDAIIKIHFLISFQQSTVNTYLCTKTGMRTKHVVIVKKLHGEQQ